jgi:hypothetical protein
MPRRERTIIQGVAEETRVFHIRITLFIFNIKKVLITQKEGILMQFKSTYQITYGKCQSDDVLLAGHTFGASPQNPASPFSLCQRFPALFALHDRSGSSTCFNPSQYSVSIWNCTSTLNIDLSTEKTLDSNYGITVSKNTARQQTHYAVRSSSPWLLKLHCLSCPPVHAERQQPHPCRVLAI